MITISKQTTLNIILFGVVTVLLIMLYFSACNKPIKVPDTHVADSLVLKAQADLKEGQRKNDSTAKIAAYWKAKYDTIWQSVKLGWVAIDKKDKKIQQLLDSNTKFKLANDTLSQLANCDDLIGQIDTLMNLLSKAQIQIDSLHTSADSTISQQTQQIALLTTILFDYNKQLIALKAQYDDLVKSNKKTINRLKLEDIIAKAGTIAAAVLAVTVILIK